MARCYHWATVLVKYLDEGAVFRYRKEMEDACKVCGEESNYGLTGVRNSIEVYHFFLCTKHYHDWDPTLDRGLCVPEDPEAVEVPLSVVEDEITTPKTFSIFS